MRKNLGLSLFVVVSLIWMGFMLNGVRKQMQHPAIVHAQQIPTSVTLPILAGAATTTQIATGGTNQNIYVDNMFLDAFSTSGTAKFEYGSGANCAIGTTALTAAFSSGTSTFFQGSPVMVTALSSNPGVSMNLCVVTTGAGAVLNGWATLHFN